MPIGYQETEPAARGGSGIRQGTVLVVEDNRSLREFVTLILREQGLGVLAAEAVDEAVAIVKQHGKPVDLAIIDMTLTAPSRAPDFGTSGLDLAVELERLQAGIKILYITGNLSAIAMQAIWQHSPGHVLFKPFTAQQILERVAGLLARPAGGSR